MKSFKFQSAMEYLMTYGWAILIIAIVLGVLYFLGVFGGNLTAPRAAAGSCQVFKQNSGGSLTASLSGTCNNELPEYVAQFNGATSYITTGTSGLPVGSAARSVFAWIYVSSAPSGGGAVFSEGETSDPNLAKLQINPSDDVIFNQGAGLGYTTGTLAITNGAWNFVGYTYTAGANTITLYVNGQSETGTLSGGTLNTILPGSNPASIGTAQTLANYFPGEISNVQVYNYTLSSNEVEALYLEGIGGAPINPAGIVAWWPLNGNLNDYSGDQDTGTPTALTYSSSWVSAYTPP